MTAWVRCSASDRTPAGAGRWCRPDPRPASGSSMSRQAPAWSPPSSCARRGCEVVGLDQSEAMLSGRRTAHRCPGWPSGSARAGEAERLPSPTASSTPSASPICSATSMIGRARCPSSPAWSSPAAGSGCSSSASRRSRRSAALARAHPPGSAVAGPGGVARVVSRWVVSWGRVSRVCTPRTRSARFWRAAGIGEVSQQRMSFGAGLSCGG